MKKYFLLINVIVGFSCSSSVDQQPPIPSAQMVELLIDIHILEARVDKLRISNDSAYAVFNTMQSKLFEDHGVTKDYYEYSYQHYLENPKDLDHIYGIVVDSLNVIQKRGYQHKSELVELESEIDTLAVSDSLADVELEEKVGLIKDFPDSLAKATKATKPTKAPIRDRSLDDHKARLKAKDSARIRKATMEALELNKDSLR